MPSPQSSIPRIQTGVVKALTPLCDEHFRLTIQVPHLREAAPGQFVHLCAPTDDTPHDCTVDDNHVSHHNLWATRCHAPMLRRAFSIAGVETTEDGVQVDLIFRVVGKATQWMASLQPGHRVSLLAPLGNCFPIPRARKKAWLIAGGVGLPPMLWLAQVLSQAGKHAILFYGAQSSQLLALDLGQDAPCSTDATQAVLASPSLAASNVPVVISTDDGSVGLHGHIGDAIEAHYASASPDTNDLVMYTCGPERMMRFVADFCSDRNIECYVCVERAMACGTGTCQSCVVPIRNDADPQGWQYQLCCAEGPVFDAQTIVWETPANT